MRGMGGIIKVVVIIARGGKKQPSPRLINIVSSIVVELLLVDGGMGGATKTITAHM